MRTQAGLHIDPGALAAGPGARELEVVVPYTEWALAEATLQRAAVLAAGLNVRVRLVAVHSVPYAVSFGCPAAVHAHLVEQLVDLASRCQFPVEPQVVMARGWVEGFQYALHPDSTVLVGTRKHFWRTREESLARDLAGRFGLLPAGLGFGFALAGLGLAARRRAGLFDRAAQCLVAGRLLPFVGHPAFPGVDVGAADLQRGLHRRDLR